MANPQIDALEELIQTCRDSQMGYQKAAEYIQNYETRNWFNLQSLERARFAGELENEVQRMGKHDPERKGSVSGAIHRGWFELKEKFSASDKSVLEEVERGEDAAKKSYEDALKKDIPEDVAEIVRRQAQSVFAAHDRVKALRDLAKRAA